MQTMMVQRLLTNARDIDSALELIKTHNTRGAWTLCMSHAATDRVCYIEFDGANYQIRPALSTLIATNHQQLSEAAHKNLSNSEVKASHHRYNRLRELLVMPVRFRSLQKVSARPLRDEHDPENQDQAQHPTMNSVKRSDNHISVIMQPSAGKVWVTPGPNANGHRDNFSLIDLTIALPEWNSEVSSSTESAPAVNDTVTEQASFTPAVSKSVQVSVQQPRQLVKMLSGQGSQPGMPSPTRPPA
ncbi:MAG: carcinine hydrolase/isopenicillin-N N-acyltransferase family protein [Planctomycetaceae bacterium]